MDVIAEVQIMLMKLLNTHLQLVGTIFVVISSAKSTYFCFIILK